MIILRVQMYLILASHSNLGIAYLKLQNKDNSIAVIEKAVEHGLRGAQLKFQNSANNNFPLGIEFRGLLC